MQFFIKGFGKIVSRTLQKEKRTGRHKKNSRFVKDWSSTVKEQISTLQPFGMTKQKNDSYQAIEISQRMKT
jgi:hypothetical protein